MRRARGERTRVLIVCQPVEGGVPRHVEQLLAFTDRDRFDLQIACPPGRLAEVARTHGVPWRPLAMGRAPNPLRDALALTSLARIVLRAGPFDVLHLHSSKAGLAGRCLRALGMRVPVVFTPHAFSFLSATGRTRALYLGCERLLRRFTDRLVAVSDSEARIARESLGFPTARVVTIANGIEWRELGGIRATEEFDLVWVGRVSYQKNPEMLVELLDACRRRGLPVRAHVVGASGAKSIEGSGTAAFLQAIEARGLRERVAISGWLTRDEALRAIAGARIMVQTSRYEGLPYTLLEAMALGRPVVATDVPGNRDVVRHGRTGYLVGTGDVEGMLARVEELLRDDGVRASMGRAARAVVTARHDVRRSVRAIEQVYLRAASQEVAQPAPGEAWAHGSGS